MNQKNGGGSKIILEEAVGLAQARAMFEEMDINQEELAVLARLAARQRNLRKARKISRSAVSKFLHGSLPQGHTFTAIRHAIQDYLGIQIDFDIDILDHA